MFQLFLLKVINLTIMDGPKLSWSIQRKIALYVHFKLFHTLPIIYSLYHCLSNGASHQYAVLVVMYS